MLFSLEDSKCCHIFQFCFVAYTIITCYVIFTVTIVYIYIYILQQKQIYIIDMDSLQKNQFIIINNK